MSNSVSMARPGCSMLLHQSSRRMTWRCLTLDIGGPFAWPARFWRFCTLDRYTREPVGILTVSPVCFFYWLPTSVSRVYQMYPDVLKGGGAETVWGLNLHFDAVIDIRWCLRWFQVCHGLRIVRRQRHLTTFYVSVCQQIAPTYTCKNVCTLSHCVWFSYIFQQVSKIIK